MGSAADGLLGLIAAPLASPPIINDTASVVPSGTSDLQWDDLVTLNDETLQLWAADCLPSFITPQPTNPFDPLSDLLAPFSPPPAPVITSPASSVDSTAMLRHYREKMAKMLTCGDGPDIPNAFDAFAALAKASMSTASGQGLHFSILAWAGRHMANKGQERYEVPSERLANQASQIVLERCAVVPGPDETMTLFAALLMLVQYKVGYERHHMSDSRSVGETSGASRFTSTICHLWFGYCTRPHRNPIS